MVGGAILGAALGGPVGLVVGAVLSGVAATWVNQSKREDNNG
jgi:predicted PurR-regulated permease PerM